MRRLPALALAGLLVGCGGGSAATSAPPSSGPSIAPVPTMSAPAARPAPRTLTPADDGRTYTMQTGQTAELIVRDPQAPDPVVDGVSVEVIEVVNIDASGQREWELRAITPGRTVLRATGSQPYTITLDVVGS